MAKGRSGHIRARGKGHQALYSTTDPATGKQRFRSASFRTRREAQEWLTSKLAAVNAGTDDDPRGRTLGGWLEEWLAGIKLDVRPTTWSWYASAVRRHIVPKLGGLKLEAVRPGHLKAMYAEKLEHGRLDGGGALSPASVKRLHITLHRAFDAAVKDDILARNPADRVSPPRVPRHDATSKVWTPEQLACFLDFTSTDRLAALWRLAVMTGMRRGEILGLRWSDVNLEAGHLAVRQTLVLHDGAPAYSTPKTAAGRRRIELDSATVVALRSHRAQQLTERLALGPVYEDSDLCFCREEGRPLRPDWLTRRFKTLAVDADLPEITFHMIRHSHATALLAAGTHPSVASERLGHSSVAITLDVYSAVLPTLQREAVDQLADVLNG